MTFQSSLFRRSAQDAQRSRIFGEIILVRPLSLSILTATVTCMTLAAVLFFAYGSYTRRTTVEGVLMPDTGLVKIYARQAGVILRRHVAEGQHVSRGQVLYTISADLQSVIAGDTQAALIDQAHLRKASLQQEIEKTRHLQDGERDTQQARVASLRVQLTDINDQIRAQHARVLLAADAAARYTGLLAQDYVSKDVAQQREADLLDQQSKLNNLQRDRTNTAQSLKEATSELAGLSFRQQNQLSQISRNVIDVDQTVIESESKRELVIVAPESGLATAVIAEPGQTIDTSHPLASIVPMDSRWQAYLFVPSAAIGFIHIGDPVLIRYQAYPYQKFGQYAAHVVSIARTALSSAELATSIGPASRDGTFYRITVALKSQHVIAYGKPQSLQAGMTLQADVLQERRRLYEWALEPLYSLTGKL